jgi:hypothetical protein
MKPKDQQKTEEEKNLPATQPTGGAVAAYDYGEDAGQGFENHGKDDYAIPFLGVLQSNSPEVETIAAAKPGMLINTVTQELFDGAAGIVFIPCHTEHVFVEWVPREKGGGFVGLHDINSEVVKKAKAEQDFGKYKLANGNDLIETFYVYGVRVTDVGAEQMVIAFSSTKIKKYKGWMTKARAIQIPLEGGRRITPPLFAHTYKVFAVKERNNKGEFWNFEISFTGEDAATSRIKPNDPLYQSARAIRDLVISGKAKADHGSQQAAAEDEKPPF